MSKIAWLLLALLTTQLIIFPAGAIDHTEVVAVIGTGNIGGALGKRIAEQNYRVVYGSRNPKSDKVKALLRQTGEGASATTQRAAAQQADIVLLAVPWPHMTKVAINLGNLSGKIVVDVSNPVIQGEDGYALHTADPSGAELIQNWNPGATVVKAFNTVSYNVVADPSSVDGIISVPIASNDRAAKEKVANIIAGMGFDPIDAGPLRHARELEGMVVLFSVPIYQRRQDSFEFYFRRSTHWCKNWGEGWSNPVNDAGNLANIPGNSTKVCNP